MDDILETTFLNCIIQKNILDSFHSVFFSKCLIYNKWALVQVIGLAPIRR